MKNFAVQSKLVRTPSENPTTDNNQTGGYTFDPVALHVIAKKQVEHTAIAVVSVYATLKLTDVLATAAKHLITTKIK